MPLRLTLKGIPPSEEITKAVLEKSNGKVMLAFSCGKDSIAAWLALKQAGANVYPYFYYIHPDLGFINRSLAYYEEFFGTRIVRLPAPGLYRQWKRCVHQSPERIAPILSSTLPVFGHDELMAAAKMVHKFPAAMFTALGIRAADSVNRRTHFVRSGAINHKAFKFYPVWDWTKEAVRVEMFKAKVKLPVDYWLFGRTFDGLDYRFIGPLKKHFPEDYEKLKEHYPLLDAELKRAEFAGMKEHL